MITFGSVMAISKFVSKWGQFGLISLKLVNCYLSGIIGEIIVTVGYLNVAEIKCGKYDSFLNELAIFGFTRLRNPRAFNEIDLISIYRFWVTSYMVCYHSLGGC